jgi:hypothetical protein
MNIIPAPPDVRTGRFLRCVGVSLGAVAGKSLTPQAVIRPGFHTYGSRGNFSGEGEIRTPLYGRPVRPFMRRYVLGTFEDSKVPYPQFVKNTGIPVQSGFLSRGRGPNHASARDGHSNSAKLAAASPPTLATPPEIGLSALMITAEPALRLTADDFAPADSADSPPPILCLLIHFERIHITRWRSRRMQSNLERTPI